MFGRQRRCVNIFIHCVHAKHNTPLRIFRVPKSFICILLQRLNNIAQIYIFRFLLGFQNDVPWYVGS